jgi:uncharacterized protein (TIRG00374 family)
VVASKEPGAGGPLKRAISIGLKVIGVALVVFILAQVNYRDSLRLPSGDVVKGSVEDRDGVDVFVPLDGSDALPLPPDWEVALHDSPVTLGLFTIVRRSNKLLLLLCFLSYGPICLISITRWWYLLRRVDLPIPFKEAFRLSFIGFFFNSAVPGQTGGDLIKAFYIAKQKQDAKMRAFMTVLVDRVIGLFALGLLSGSILIFRLGDPEFRIAGYIVYSFLGACIAFGAIFLSRRLRKLIHLEALIAKLPFKRLSHLLQEVDRAIVIYRTRPGAVIVAVLLSLLNHVSLMFMTVGIGRALRIEIPVSTFAILVPVCMMVASVPLLPGGWGLREGAFAYFFGAKGVAVGFAYATALSVTMGLTQLGWSLLGGIFFIFSRDRVSRKELQNFSDEVDARVEKQAAGDADPAVP